MSFTDRLKPSPPNQNFVAMLIKQKALVYSLRCAFDGENAWYIFEVESSKRSEFEKRFNNAEHRKWKYQCSDNHDRRESK